ncbi:MAG: hypothetical protein QM483_03025, partial [Desulfuromusa sp.]
IVPGVQYSEGSLNSFTGGEIAPPVVSVSGSRFYDNNYTIDGISNNSPLDPASDAFSDANKLPGHPQIQFLNPSIIGQVTVYNSNIPAEFGGFTGGQIDTETIDPTSEFWEKINYRTTSDSWTKFHIHPVDHDDFYASNSAKMQPHFRKHNFGMTINIPINNDTGMLTSYQQLYSKIPLLNFDATKTQTRRQENFFIKLNHYLADDSQISLTALYSPTHADYFRPNIKGSDYTLNNKNFSLGLQFEKEVDYGKLKLTLGYNDQNSGRQAAANRYYWNPATDSIDWSSGREGGIGAVKTSQKALSFKADISFHSFKWGQLDHQVKLGVDSTYSKQNYHRPTTSYYYYRPVLDSSVICSPGDFACIDNEQYLTRRTVYNKSDSTAEVADYAAYIQDSVVWKRLEIFPGIRASYDDFTKGLNIAPRFSASWDILGNRKTVLFAGLNRYYSGTLLTQSLYKSIITENQRRTTSGNSETDWISSTSFLYKDGKVETPYTDETTIGFVQQLLGGNMKVQYIKKISKDEFARHRINNPSPDPDIYMLNNNGRSEHESYILTWQRSWKNHFLEINGTWQQTTSSNTDYDTNLDKEDITETIWYNGEELYRHEIPRLDFNRPFVANLTYIFQPTSNITFTNRTRYREAYWRLWYTSETQPSVINPEQSSDPHIYEKRKSQSSVIFDWRLSWRIPKFSKQDIVLSLDVFNVFNRRAKIGYQSGTYGYKYELGRQFWAGLEFNF